MGRLLDSVLAVKPTHDKRDDSCPAWARAGSDDGVVRELVVRTLASEGYTVTAVGEGAAALEAFEGATVRPALVITDIIMPGMNGRQLSEAIEGRWRGTPVLFMSGHTGGDAVIGRLVPVGAPYLQKPFTPDDLVQAVETLLPPWRGSERTMSTWVLRLCLKPCHCPCQAT